VLQTPPRPVVYDFGPGAVVQAAVSPTPSTAPALPTLVLAEVETTAALDSTAVLYRLAYSDAQQLRPYAQARWSMPPAQLVRQRLRETLGRQRVVLSPGEGIAPGTAALSLRIGVEEFSQWFESADKSSGLVRLRATLSQTGGGAGFAGERLIAQRSFVLQRGSATADAAGGAQALAGATDAAIAELDQWLQQSQPLIQNTR
jgi:cholesterol transport system auxiliary component